MPFVESARRMACNSLLGAGQRCIPRAPPAGLARRAAAVLAIRGGGRLRGTAARPEAASLGRITQSCRPCLADLSAPASGGLRSSGCYSQSSGGGARVPLRPDGPGSRRTVPEPDSIDEEPVSILGGRSRSGAGGTGVARERVQRGKWSASGWHKSAATGLKPVRGETSSPPIQQAGDHGYPATGQARGPPS